VNRLILKCNIFNKNQQLISK